MELAHGGAQQVVAGLVHLAELTDLRRPHVRIGQQPAAAIGRRGEALPLPLPRRLDPAADDARGLPAVGIAQFLEIDPRHLHVDVDTCTCAALGARAGVRSSRGPESRFWYLLIMAGEQVHSRTESPYQPHGQGYSQSNHLSDG